MYYIDARTQQPPHQGKAKGLAACNSQTTSPFGCLNNFYFKILSEFSGSLHSCPALFCRLDAEIKAQKAQNQQMNGIKPIIKHFVLFAALAVVCKCQTEAQKRPRLFEHGGIAEGNGKNRHIVEQIKEITDQDGMMLVVETQGHGNNAHDQNN